MKTFNRLAAVLIALSAGAACAQTSAAQQAAEPWASMTQGEVRKVDRDAGKVTLRHGPIPNLDMSAMTMVFKAADPAMLETLKEGDTVRFAADRVGGVLTVTQIEAAR